MDLINVNIIFNLLKVENDLLRIFVETESVANICKRIFKFRKNYSQYSSDVIAV